MATTTNYGWTTPDDTALVKDGAAAIRTLGSSVDTTTKALNPSTTLGDIEYRSSTANTNTRLGIGTTGQVLSVSGGVPAWSTLSSGGMTLISTTALTGASVSLTSIPQTYNDLRLVIRDFYPATNDSTILITINSDTGNNYTYVRTRSTASTVSENVSGTNFPLNDRNVQQSGSDTNAHASLNFYDYTVALDHLIEGVFVYERSDAVTPIVTIAGTYFPSTSAAVTSIQLAPNAGNFGGGTALLYGVK
jgi:hypothetical protein